MTEIDVSGCIYKKDDIADCGNPACGGYKCEGQICLYKQVKMLEQENAKLKEAFKKAKEVIAYCYDEEKPFTSCIDCKYYDGCKIQPVDYALRIIEGALKDE